MNLSRNPHPNRVTNDESDLRDLAWVRALCAGGHVRAIRHRARLSQRELGVAVHVSPETIHRWESGAGMPSGKRAIAYARALRAVYEVTERAHDAR